MNSREISHYRIITRLGAGGMGEVYLAEDTRLDRKVAIKMLPEGAVDDPHAKERLIREARAAATLDHSNICSIYEVGEDADRTFIVMQYIEGEVLAQKIRNKPLSIAEVVDIGLQATDALAEAHLRGVIHRDIKPHNVIITPRGQVKILDFGLAKFMPEVRAADPRAMTEHRLTEAGQVVGTPGYMSPEQLQGEPVDARTDIFSLGIVLYECATGRHAFAGAVPFQISMQVVNSNPTRPSQLNPLIPAAFDQIIARAMAKSVDARYESAAAFRADLSRFQAGLKEKGGTGTLPLEALEALEALAARPSLATSVLPSHESARLETSVIPSLRSTKSDSKGPGRRVWMAIAAVIAILGIWLAARAFLTSRGEPPAEAKLWYDRGTTAIREGAYYQASKALERSVELSRNFGLAHARLADAYAEIDQTDKAREELLLAISLVGGGPSLSSADATYLDAISGTLRRDFASAIQSYSRIADQAPASEKAAAYVDLGRAYEKNETIDKAIEYYGKATRQDPQSAAGFLREAILYGRRGDISKATGSFEQAEKIYQAMSSQEGLAEVYYQRGTMLTKSRKLPQAKTQLDRALEISRGTDNKFQSVRTQLQLSGVYYAEGDTERAKKTAAEAIAAAQGASIRNLATNGLIDLGYTLLSRGELVEARSYFAQALDFAKQDRASRIEARAKLGLGSVSVQMENQDEAIAFLGEALKFFQPAGYRKETSNALILLGRAYREKGEYKIALKTFEQQLDVAGKLGDPAQVAASHSGIALLLGIHQERYAEALPHVEESYKINKSLGAKVLMGWDQLNRGTFLWQLGRYSEASAALDEVFAVANRPEANLKSQLAWVEVTRSQIALSEGRLGEAKAKAQISLELAGTQYADIALQAKQTIGLAQAFSGSAQQARKSCEEAVATARQLKSPRTISTALLVLAEVLLRARDVEGALKNAIEAQRMFAPAGQLDSEWRSLLIAALAGDQMTDKATALQYATKAKAQREALATRWGAEADNGYSSRPDIKTYLKQLDQLLARSK
ncbi:MAG: tetratricopeptide repeat protein [Acidobacteriota bacterium]